ncbi:hypothetical protein [Leifsonia aquatica]|uniref:hypothetical protein n=1 Tax=Leifsonia aquatica TaxID=144185 RepID=UPI00046A491E|nr:hypothetical protein [Leifsonia aquatica]
MATRTPAQLSLELGVDQKRIRDALRDLYGTLEEGITRWHLTETQADAIRARFGGEASTRVPTWTLEPGDTVLRRELHEALGGSRQSGIVTLRGLPDIVVFSSVESGAGFGYHLFEGLQPDGSFSYTGEGQRGDQVFKRGNLALRESGPDGRPIRLFTVSGTSATFVGTFATGDPTCSIETIPDVEGNPRNGIIFNLVPVDADASLLAAPSAPAVPSAHVTRWTPPDAADIVVVNEVPALPSDRVVSRVEFELQADFGAWLRARGNEPQRLQLATSGTTIEPDLYVESLGWIVEAKRSSGRDYVRHAIGQVLDYVHVAAEAGIQAEPMVLLPGRPTADLVSLLHHHKIAIAVRDGSEFEVVRA